MHQPIVLSADIELRQINVGALTQFHVLRLSEQDREECEEKKNKYSFLGQVQRYVADCSFATTTEAPSCLRDGSYKVQDKCVGLHNQAAT